MIPFIHPISEVHILFFPPNFQSQMENKQSKLRFYIQFTLGENAISNSTPASKIFHKQSYT